MSTKYLDMMLRTSPHIGQGGDTATIMRHVVYALLPLLAMATYVFGTAALLLGLVCAASAILTEAAYCRLRKLPSTLGDNTAAITGLLLGLTLPPGFPLWMGAVGGVISIALGKLLFGGLGYNVFNPTLVGRAFLQAAFPVAITTWHTPFAAERFTTLPVSTLALPFLKALPDATTGATPLSVLKFDHVLASYSDLFYGTVYGSAGETSALLVLVCGAYLALRKMLDWRIPAGILGAVALLSGLLHWLHPGYPPAGFMLLSGGLLLGAIFMATDMVTSPVTPVGVWLYAAFIGALTVVIRIWGGLPEGVMYAILLGNALTPLLNRITMPRVYGTGRKKP